MPWRDQTNDDKAYVGVYCGESEDDGPRIDRDSGRKFSRNSLSRTRRRVTMFISV